MGHKIVFAGTPGAGKTTAITVLSDLPPVVTDVLNTDTALNKQTTTVGLDYGLISMPDGTSIALFGTPGQARFDFMWRILATNALGLVLLVDNSRPNPLSDLEHYLVFFGDMLAEMNCVVGVGRTLDCPVPTVDDFADLLTAKGLAFPVLSIDARERADVFLLIELLIAQAEAKQ